MNPGVTTASPGPPAVSAPSPPARRPWFRFDNRYLAPLLITVILVVAQYYYGILEVHTSPLLSRLTFGWLKTYNPTFVAILAAVAAELVLGRFTLGKWPHLASAYVTGISVGILVRSADVWPYVLCSLLSITSKYALRVRGRHIWNPSNLGICVMLLLAPAAVAGLGIQWGNDVAPMVVVWCLGALVLYRAGRLHISLVYAASFVFFAYLRTLFTGDAFAAEVGPITGPMYQLFICFMITDPRTTTRRVWSQCLVAFLVALVEAVLRLYEPVFSPHYAQFSVYAAFYALFLVGPVSNLIEMWADSRGARAARLARNPGFN